MRFKILASLMAVAAAAACNEASNVTTGPDFKPGVPGTGASNFGTATASIVSNGRLRVDFTQGGVGNNNVDYTLTADATIVWGCINGGSNHPRAANKESFESSVEGGGSFEPRNGQISGAIFAPGLNQTAPSDDQPTEFSCPSGQTAVFFSVAYENIVLTNTIAGNSTDPTPDPISRVFFQP
jgi:hypothetical protein